MRAIAVGLVLWYHAGLPFLNGGFAGVDVFFVISGFLITGQLVREVESTGRISLPRFYGRRAKRLFPAAATVLVATALLTWAFLPRVRWEVYGADIAAAAAYVVNWQLAAQSIDYLAEGVDPSPVQHFWSLAVEEQFYIVWPLLLLVLALLIRRHRWPVRPVMGAGLALIVVPSFAWSVVATAEQPATAYFVTTTRLWELGVGALVAVGVGLWPRLPRAFAVVLGWGGVAAVVAGALLQSTTTPWPGSAALVPTLGTAAVIVAGYAAGRRGPVAVLGMRPMVWVGGLSYSLYLWHWPFVVVAGHLLGGLSYAQGAAAVLLSFVPAWLTHKLVEDPFRYSRAISRSPRLALSTGFAFSVTGALAGLLVIGLASWSQPPAPTASEARGGAVLGGPSATPPPSPTAVASTGRMTPSPLDATEDLPEAYADDCQIKEDVAAPKRCVYGDPGGTFTVALVGDSKAVQWLPAIDRIARERNWRVVLHSKSACPLTDALVPLSDGRPYTECREWGRQVMARLTGPERPDLVVTTAMRAVAFPGGDTSARPDARTIIDGYVRAWSEFAKVEAPVLVISNSPTPNGEVYECVAENPDDYMEACAFRYESNRSNRVLQAAVAEVPSARFFDLDGWVCPGLEVCRPVIGEVLVFRQGSHVTATYAASLTRPIEFALDDTLRRQGVTPPS